MPSSEQCVAAGVFSAHGNFSQRTPETTLCHRRCVRRVGMESAMWTLDSSGTKEPPQSRRKVTNILGSHYVVFNDFALHDMLVINLQLGPLLQESHHALARLLILPRDVNFGLECVYFTANQEGARYNANQYFHCPLASILRRAVPSFRFLCLVLNALKRLEHAHDFRWEGDSQFFSGRIHHHGAFFAH